MMICRACGGQTNTFQQVEGVRTEDRVISEEPFVVDTVTVEVCLCTNCGHMQTANLLPPDFYDTNDSSAQGYGQHIHALDTFDKTAKKLRSHSNGEALLEIGSGAGGFLSIGAKYFKHCTGVEPSTSVPIEKPSKNTIQEGDIEIICDYFGTHLHLTREYDAFASFQVFEHLEEPLVALQALYDVCCDNAYGIINVPNGRQIFADALYHQIILQHINYYTPESLCTLVRRAGFAVEEIEADQAAIELNLYCRKPGVSRTMNDRRAYERRQLMDGLRGKRVVVWGAGAKSITYATLLGRELNIVRVVDGNPQKVGQYIANVRVPVELPSEEAFFDADAVLVFATSYWEEIVDALRNQFHFKKEIAGFGIQGGGCA